MNRKLMIICHKYTARNDKKCIEDPAADLICSSTGKISADRQAV